MEENVFLTQDAQIMYIKLLPYIDDICIVEVFTNYGVNPFSRNKDERNIVYYAGEHVLAELNKTYPDEVISELSLIKEEFRPEADNPDELNYYE